MTVGESIAIFNNIKGIEVDTLIPSFTYKYEGEEYEVDGLAIGESMVVAIEAKATLKQKDVETFIKHKLTIFTELVPAFKGKQIYGAMGFLSASDDVKRFAQEQGLDAYPCQLTPTKPSSHFLKALSCATSILDVCIDQPHALC